MSDPIREVYEKWRGRNWWQGVSVDFTVEMWVAIKAHCERPETPEMYVRCSVADCGNESFSEIDRNHPELLRGWFHYGKQWFCSEHYPRG